MSSRAQRGTSKSSAVRLRDPSLRSGRQVSPFEAFPTWKRSGGLRIISRRRLSPSWLWAVPIWLVVLLCCALPLGWMIVRVVTQPAGVRNLLPTPFYLGLLLRTVG